MKKFIFLPIILLVLNACKKNDTKAPTKADYLTNGTWVLTDVVSDDDGDGTYETHDFTDFVTCYTDNIYTFHSNGTLEMNEGDTKCEPGDPQTDTANWQLTNSENSMVFGTDTYSIEELSPNTLVMKLSYGDNRSSKVTFNKR